MATYGIDYSVLEGTPYDLDITFQEISGVEVLIQDIYKKLSTPATLFWYQGGTIDITSFQNMTFTNQKLQQLRQELAQLFFDELRFQVDTPQVLFEAPNTLHIIVSFTPSNDPNLKLTLELVSDSNEVKIVRVQ